MRVTLPFELQSFMGARRKFLRRFASDEVRIDRESYWHARKPGATVLLIAHTDTVKTPTITGRMGGFMYGAGFDDRLGCAMGAALFDTRADCDLLLTDGEEHGASTAALVPAGDLGQYNMILGLDRAGMDFVDYGLGGAALISAFQEVTEAPHAVGSFSDISFLSGQSCGCLNIGLGHERSHAEDSYIDIAACARRFKDIGYFLDLHAGTRFLALEKKTAPWYCKPYSAADEYAADWYGTTASDDKLPDPPEDLCEACLEVLAPHELKTGLCDACYADYMHQKRACACKTTKENTWA